jgi:plastocyanin
MSTRAIAPLLLILSSGCAPPAEPTMVDIRVDDTTMFTPTRISVAVGGTVRWTNHGTIDHTVTSGASSQPSDSPGTLFDAQLPAGGTFEYTFPTGVDQPFFCRLHEAMGMTGIIHVAADATMTGGGGGVGHY